MNHNNRTSIRIYTIIIVLTLLLGGWLIYQGSGSSVALAQPENLKTQTTPIPEASGTTTVYFEENQGQFNSKAKYFARGTSGYSLFLTSNEAVYVLRSPESKVKSSKSKTDELGDTTLDFGHRTQDSPKATAVYVKLVGANENYSSVGLGKMIHKTNYFKGDESSWQTEIPNYKQVQMNNIYDGIDVNWNGNAQGEIQYDLLVKNEATVGQIELEIKGAENVELDADGNLLIKTEFGTIKQPKPNTIRRTGNFTEEFSTKFKIESAGNKFKIGFELGNRSQEKTLNIENAVTGSDLGFSTFLGDNSVDIGLDIALKNNGDIFVAGLTSSVDFPTSPGSFDTTHNGGRDVFVTHLFRQGSIILYSTFLGGSGNDEAHGIAVDSNGDAYITGFTVDAATDYPTTTGAFDTTHNGEIDVFVTKLNASGTALAYSTLIGGSGEDEGLDIDVDSSFNAYISGGTENDPTDYPTTSGAFDTSHNGNIDTFVTKLNPTGSALTYSTFLGGQGNETGMGLTLDGFRNVLVTGGTFNGGSNRLPTTTLAYDRTPNGVSDAYVTKFNINGSSLIYSTYIGGSGQDDSKSIAIDSSGNAFITGRAGEGTTPFPTTLGAFDTTYDGGTGSYVTKININGTDLVYSTFLGGSNFETTTGIAVDSSGKAIVTGGVSGGTIPTTVGAFDRSYNGGADGFITKFSLSGSALEYSTYFGGTATDGILALVTDSSDNVFITGNTTSGTNDFPTTPGAFDTTQNGSNDVFITKFTDFTLNRSTPFDFDGDSKTDVSIFRPNVGEWWYLRSSDNSNSAVQFGSSSDILAPADFTGDGKTDIAFFRPVNGEWFILRSEDSSFYSFPFGSNGDIPSPGDFDGDGIDDATVFRPSSATWYIQRSSDNQTDIIGFGVNGDKPVVADYDGDGKDDIAIFRPNNSQWWLNRSTDGVIAYQFGASGDKTVQGDYTGDGKDDVAIFKPNGEWFILRSEDGSFFSFPFGAGGDIPSPGDYDGDGKFDATVFRPSNTTWYINGSQSGTQFVGFGINGDIPVPNAFVYP